MSNRKAGENPAPRKSKVSSATEIDGGLGGPKAMAKAAVEGQPVNIPVRRRKHTDGVTKKISSSVLMVWRFRRKESHFRQIRSAVFKTKIRAQKKGSVFTVPIRTKSLPRKTSKVISAAPYRKPPQVDRASSLRGTGDSSLRNSAKKRP